ncbi:beta-lactamase hydrolase-family protein [Nostoc piscinale CENA21]|uniref:Beta-lactamase hydrolase-family protein n=1 Tax=Nostoc piscinale CENA21 TaxID=224013 RepID=A0A0M3V712_9NOSO|nr:sulfur transferase domain-containing protein [Nostoc piscinale]ALF56593.1 beta-lactamase hydrolase-family protein [Nostoc piscinale CENA21]
MITVRKINDDLAIAGQITLDQLKQLAEEGYQSVINLRSPDETSSLDNEKEKVELLGLQYINFPTNLGEINHQAALDIFQVINKSSKPTLIHCDDSIRSAAIVLLYIATKQGVTFEKALQQTINLGLISSHC